MLGNLDFLRVTAVVTLLLFLPLITVGEVVDVTSNSIDTVNLRKYKKRGNIYFTNTDSISVKISLLPVSGIDFSSSENLLISAMRNTTTDRQKAFSLWKLCSSYGFHYGFPYNSN